MMTKQKHLLTFALLPVLCFGVVAQRPSRRPHDAPGPPPFGQPGEHGPRPDFRPQGPFGPGFEFLSSEMRPDGKVVKGAPYAATILVESTQTLGDGTRITRKMNATIHRDSEGRTRREQKLDFIGPFIPKGEPPHLVFINDVVAGTHYVLNVGQQQARKLTALPRPPARMEMPRPARPDAEQSKSENLGTQVIEGIEATGTRSTITIPAGQIGNDRPLEIISERWDSPELQITVMSRHHDPRVGETVYRVTNITRSEQPHSLFEVPAGYSLTEGGPPDHDGSMMRRMRKPREE